MKTEMFRDHFEYEIEKAEEVLNDYTLEQILEDNDKTEAEVLAYLTFYGFLDYPETLPTTIHNELEQGEDE